MGNALTRGICEVQMAFELKVSSLRLIDFDLGPPARHVDLHIVIDKDYMFHDIAFDGLIDGFVDWLEKNDNFDWIDSWGSSYARIEIAPGGVVINIHDRMSGFVDIFVGSEEFLTGLKKLHPMVESIDIRAVPVLESYIQRWQSIISK